MEDSFVLPFVPYARTESEDDDEDCYCQTELGTESEDDDVPYAGTVREDDDDPQAELEKLRRARQAELEKFLRDYLTEYRGNHDFQSKGLIVVIVFVLVLSNVDIAFEMDSGIQTGYLSSIQDHIKAFLERIIVRKSNGSTDFNYVQHTTSSPGQAEKWQRQCQPAVTNPTYRFFGWLFKKNMYI